LPLKPLDPDCIRIGIQPKMLDPDPIKLIPDPQPCLQNCLATREDRIRRSCALVAAEEQHALVAAEKQHARGDSATNQSTVLPHFRHLGQALLLLSLQQAPVRFPLHHLRGSRTTLRILFMKKQFLKGLDH
jgi:hypothetical protein